MSLNYEEGEKNTHKKTLLKVLAIYKKFFAFLRNSVNRHGHVGRGSTPLRACDRKNKLNRTYHNPEQNTTKHGMKKNDLSISGKHSERARLCVCVCVRRNVFVSVRLSTTTQLTLTHSTNEN